MTQPCLQCGQDFTVPEEDLQFFDQISPIIGGNKISIPPPKLCRICRLQRRTAFRNERTLYRRNCDATGKPMLSMFSPDSPFTVYHRDYWWSDAWDATKYGRDFDFSKTLTEQLRSLSEAVPHASLYQVNLENSEYCSYALNFKNCYLIFGGGNNEDCLYGKFVVNSDHCVDSLSIQNCHWCYEASFSDSCHHCHFVRNSRNCADSLFLEDCISCRDSMLCFGLRNKEYCVMNEFVGKERFEKMKAELYPLTAEKIQMLEERMKILKAQFPHPASHIYASENCSGDMVVNCKNCQFSFDAKDCEDCKYINFTPKNIRSYDCTFNAPDGARFSYELCSTTDQEGSFFSFMTWYGSANLYSMECYHTDHLFACVAMRSKSYCILNQQYTQEEYEVLVPKIIEHLRTTGEWGEFLSPSLSFFGYNETNAQEFFPLTREQALQKGFQWQDTEPLPQTSTTEAKNILQCGQCRKSFKTIETEERFYISEGLPIPKLCHTCRHKARLQIRPSFELFERPCSSCSKSMQSLIAPDRPEKVLCEECYLKQVY